MRAYVFRLGAIVTALFAVACGGGDAVEAPAEAPADAGSAEWTLDRRSWHQGTFAAMAEMVDYDVKRLALSASMTPEELDTVLQDAIEIAARHNVQVFPEDDFLVTDLFSAALTDGKTILFLCHDSTWQEYEALKGDKLRLVEAGEYEGEARTEIARRFGRLLSYPEATIERELVQ